MPFYCRHTRITDTQRDPKKFHIDRKCIISINEIQKCDAPSFRLPFMTQFTLINIFCKEIHLFVYQN